MLPNLFHKHCGGLTDAVELWGRVGVVVVTYQQLLGNNGTVRGFFRIQVLSGCSDLSASVFSIISGWGIKLVSDSYFHFFSNLGRVDYSFRDTF